MFNQKLKAAKNPSCLFDFVIMPVCLPAFGGVEISLLKLSYDAEKLHLTCSRLEHEFVIR
jgi:hypothetical protein